MILNIVNTPAQTIELDRQYDPLPDNFKPHGLWYCLGDDWIKWCVSAQGATQRSWLYQNYFSIELDRRSMLVIETLAGLLDFISTYGIEHGEYVKFIDWAKVKQDFAGIEFPNYYRLKHQFKQAGNLAYIKHAWFMAWDFPSGCIWDLTQVTSFKSLDMAQLTIE